jgi:nucleoside phosphorylase
LYGDDEFKKIYNLLLKDIKFRLWIHLEYRDDVTNSYGLAVAQSIQSEYPLLKLQFITRKTKIVDLDGYDVYYMYNTNSFDWRNFDFAQMPVNEPLTICQKDKLEKNNHENEREFGIITALYKDEYTSFLDNMEHESIRDIKNGTIGKHIKLQKCDYQEDFVIVNQDRMGVIDAASFATKLVSKYNPRFLIMSGVCGGRASKNIKLYDIIIPSQIFDYMTGKLEAGKFIPHNHNSSANKNLISYIEKKKDQIKANMMVLSRSDVKKIVDKIAIHIGDFACGPWVVKTTDYMDNELAKEEKKNILGLEMESLSILRVNENFQGAGHYALIVKSVMDFTDDKKSDGENGVIKSTAAYISYLCIRALMPILSEFEDLNI